ncbi:MAG: DoxX family protein [Chitinophagaceae bacterium]|nr:DoxX family protein [Chitinophagaceae bacterium]MBL0335278.1 DoxX family protein [Chitinophagaceae bacterium]
MKKLFSTKYTDRSVTLALFLLRLVFGGLMMVHGYDKLTHFNSMARMMPDPFHLGSTVTMSLAVFAEFFCAALVVLGLLTRLAAVPVIINMVFALKLGHHWHIAGGGEMATLFLGGFLAILIMGPGKFSVDRLIGK